MSSRLECDRCERKTEWQERPEPCQVHRGFPRPNECSECERALTTTSIFRKPGDACDKCGHGRLQRPLHERFFGAVRRDGYERGWLDAMAHAGAVLHRTDARLSSCDMEARGARGRMTAAYPLTRPEDSPDAAMRAAYACGRAEGVAEATRAAHGDLVKLASTRMRKPEVG